MQIYSSYQNTHKVNKLQKHTTLKLNEIKVPHTPYVILHLSIIQVIWFEETFYYPLPTHRIAFYREFANCKQQTLWRQEL